MTNELLPSTAQVLPAEQRGTKAPRLAAVALLALAVVLIVIAVVGAWRATRDDSTSDEALFVLPAPGTGWQLSNGAVTGPTSDDDVPATDERFIDQGILYGNADGDGFDDLRSIVHYPESPLPGAQWEPASVPTGGDSYRLLDDSVTFAQQEYTYEGGWEGLGGGWTVASSPDDLVHAYDVLANDTSDLVRVAFFAPLDTSPAPTASFVMTSPEGSAFTVETATGSPLFGVATYAERVEPVDVNSAAGWVVSREGESATESVVTWSPEPGRTISVRSSAPRSAVVDAARLLQHVTADEWASAFPGPTAD